MKINWGKGIVIAIVLFIGFILYFVISMSTDEKFSHDLVTEKYYEKELKYQDRIDAAKNAQGLGEKVAIKKTADGLVLRFPEIFKEKTVKGKVFLYRPSDKQLDFEISFSKTNNYLLVPDQSLLGGRWNISIEIAYQKKDYLFTEEILYE